MLEAIDPTKVKEYLNPLIDKIAEIHYVDVAWIKAIISQESAWNPFAVRFESAYPYLYHPEIFISPFITMATEINTQKTSWGLGQIMGALYREQGGNGFIPELLIPEVNLRHIAIRLAELKRKSQDPLYVFAGYNGGFGAMRKQANGLFPNQKYVTSVASYLKQKNSV